MKRIVTMQDLVLHTENAPLTVALPVALRHGAGLRRAADGPVLLRRHNLPSMGFPL